MYEKVIIPSDGSKCAERGVNEALSMARSLGITATAIFVIDTSEYEGLHHESIKTAVKTGLNKVGLRVLEDIKQRGMKMGVEVETRIAKGRPYVEICAVADEGDIIFISSHGHSGWTRFFVGSTTDKVIKNAPCTVAVVRGLHRE